MFKPSERLQVLAWLAAVAASALAAFCTPAAQTRAEERVPPASVAPGPAAPAEFAPVPRDEAALEDSEANMELAEQVLARVAPRIDPQSLRSLQVRWPTAAALLPRQRAGTRSCRRAPYCD